MYQYKDRNAARLKVRRRIRGTVCGTPERPRLAVFRSLKHIYAQVIDDLAGHTLAAASSLDAECKGKAPRGGNLKAAEVVGEMIAARLTARGVSAVVFDRGGYRYHGRVKALAEAARKGGLNF